MPEGLCPENRPHFFERWGFALGYPAKTRNLAEFQIIATIKSRNSVKFGLILEHITILAEVRILTLQSKL